jgi:hypothetical protein
LHNPVVLLLLGADHTENSFPYIVACWELFTEPLPSNASIKSVTIFLISSISSTASIPLSFFSYDWTLITETVVFRGVEFLDSDNAATTHRGRGISLSLLHFTFIKVNIIKCSNNINHKYFNILAKCSAIYTGLEEQLWGRGDDSLLTVFHFSGSIIWSDGLLSVGQNLKRAVQWVSTKRLALQFSSSMGLILEYSSTLPHQPVGFFLSMALPAHSGPWSLIQFRNHFSQTLGLLGRVISPS